MTWIILAVLAGLGLIGGIVLLATSNSNNQTKSNNTEVITTDEKGNQTIQDIYRAPARTMYLNTAPAVPMSIPVPMQMPIPVAQPEVKEQKQKLYDDTNLKKDISNLKGGINSLNTMLTTQQQIKKCEEENEKLEKESKALEENFNNEKENGVNEFFEELNKLTNAGDLDSDVKEIFKTILEIKKANVSPLDKEKILLAIDGLANSGTFVANQAQNNYEKAITTLDVNSGNFYDQHKTKKDILKDSVTTILDSNDPDKLVKAVDDIITQFSKNNQKNNVNDLISDGVADNSDTSLKGMFESNNGLNGINNQTRVCFKKLCDNLKAVQDKVYTRTIDDSNNNANNNKLSNRSIKNKYLGDDNLYVDQGSANNAKFEETLKKVCEQNKKIRQTKEFVKNDEDKNIKNLNDKLVAQFKLLNNQTDTTKQNEIKDNIKNVIVGELMNVKNEETNFNPNHSDRKKMWNYLSSIGIELGSMPAGSPATTTTGAQDIGIITNANISGLDKCVLNDNDICEKMSKIILNNKTIEKNKKKIAQLNTNVSPSL